MLTDHLEPAVRLGEHEAPTDRAMLALQYVIAFVAVAAAGLLALVH